jgi:heat shock protein HslJ
MVPAAKGAVASLVFRPGGDLSGTTGCNSFGGSYTVQGAALHISLGPMTQMACLDPASTAQETALVQLLPTVRGHAVTGTALALTGAGGSSLLVYAAGAATLVGLSFGVTGVNNGRGAVETSALTAALTARFVADGSFQAFGGCNELTGTYRTSGAAGIEIGPLTSTHKACTEEVDALEAAYVAALGRVSSYDLVGGRLTLRDREGATQVTAAVIP